MSSMLSMGRTTPAIHARHVLRDFLSRLLPRISKVCGDPVLQCRPVMHKMLPVVLY